MAGGGRFAVADAGADAGLQRFVNLPLDGVEIEAAAEEDAGFVELLGGGDDVGGLARVVGVAGVGHVVAGDLNRGLMDGEGGPTDV